jgi:DNA (cytosine-5)-methyltransferase 1
MLLVTQEGVSLSDEAPSTAAEPATALSRTMFDLFAGCGGLSLGFEHAGFVPIFVNELNDDARATYLANRNHSLGDKLFVKHEQLISADVNELDETRLSHVKNYIEALDLGVKFGPHCTLDVLAGGPPCQGYSGIGHRRSYAVDKVGLPSNQLYDKMAQVIENIRPRIFLFENVKGLLSSRWTDEGQKGEIWRDVYGRFKALGREHGYQVRWKLVYAKDYGVPQNRPRVLIVGMRNDLVAKLGNWLNLSADQDDAVLCGLLPAHGEIAPNIEDIFSDLEDEQVIKRLKKQDFDGTFATLCYPQAAVGKWQKYFRPGDLGKRLATLEEQHYSRHSKKVVEKFSCMIKSGGTIPKKFQTKKFAQRLLPRAWGNQGPTITACSLADDYVHYSQPRSLTVREWARLQTFPDTYTFKGKRTTGGIRRAGNPLEGNFDREVPKYTQIGNAVPVKLAEAVAKHFDGLLVKAGF